MAVQAERRRTRHTQRGKVMPTLAATTNYRYIHPEAIVETCSRTESDGTQLIFACPMCGEKASFSTVERVGQCFLCAGTIKLHSTYDDTSIAALFGDLAPHLPLATAGYPLKAGHFGVGHVL